MEQTVYLMGKPWSQWSDTIINKLKDEEPGESLRLLSGHHLISNAKGWTSPQSFSFCFPEINSNVPTLTDAQGCTNQKLPSGKRSDKHIKNFETSYPGNIFFFPRTVGVLFLIPSILSLMETCLPYLASFLQAVNHNLPPFSPVQSL